MSWWLAVVAEADDVTFHSIPFRSVFHRSDPRHVTREIVVVSIEACLVVKTNWSHLLISQPVSFVSSTLFAWSILLGSGWRQAWSNGLRDVWQSSFSASSKSSSAWKTSRPLYALLWLCSRPNAPARLLGCLLRCRRRRVCCLRRGCFVRARWGLGWCAQSCRLPGSRSGSWGSTTALFPTLAACAAAWPLPVSLVVSVWSSSSSVGVDWSFFFSSVIVHVPAFDAVQTRLVRRFLKVKCWPKNLIFPSGCGASMFVPWTATVLPLPRFDVVLEIIGFSWGVPS